MLYNPIRVQVADSESSTTEGFMYDIKMVDSTKTLAVCWLIEQGRWYTTDIKNVTPLEVSTKKTILNETL